MNRRMDRNWKYDVIRYPEPAIESLDPRFDKYMLGSAALERIWTGGRWTEGPVWFGDMRSLLWSNIPNNRIMRWAEETGKTTGSLLPPASLCTACTLRH